MKEKRTYWLYHNGQPIYAVRLSEGASDADVRYAAITMHDRVPLCYPDFAPFEFRSVLIRAEVLRA